MKERKINVVICDRELIESGMERSWVFVTSYLRMVVYILKGILLGNMTFPKLGIT